MSDRLRRGADVRCFSIYFTCAAHDDCLSLHCCCYLQVWLAVQDILEEEDSGYLMSGEGESG